MSATSEDLVEVLKRKICPVCRVLGRLLAGPGYERYKIRCQDCGHRFRLGG